MKNVILSSLSIILISFGSLSAQINRQFEFYAVGLLATGEFVDAYESGIEGGGAVYIPVGKPMVSLTAGVGYMYIPGKEVTVTRGYMIITGSAADYKLAKIFVGAYIGKKTGLFFMPAINGTFGEDWNHAGFDLAAGYLLPVKNLGVSIKARYTMLNPFGKEGERDMNMAGIGLGVHF